MKSKSISKVQAAIRHRRGGQAARGHVERHVPPMIDRRGEREPDLADDLRPHVQCGAGLLPVSIGKRRPPGIFHCASLVEILGEGGAHRFRHHRDMAVIRVVEADDDLRARFFEAAICSGANGKRTNCTDEALPSGSVFSRVGSGSPRTLSPARSINAHSRCRRAAPGSWRGDADRRSRTSPWRPARCLAGSAGYRPRARPRSAPRRPSRCRASPGPAATSSSKFSK